MSYFDKHLLPGETILYRAQVHWAVFLFPMFFTILTIIFFYIPHVLAYVNYGSCVLTFCFWISAYVYYLTEDFVLTNQRLLMKVGLLRKNILDTLLIQIETIEVRRYLFARLFDYGAIQFSGKVGRKQVFSYVASPLVFRDKVQAQIQLQRELLDEQ